MKTFEDIYRETFGMSPNESSNVEDGSIEMEEPRPNRDSVLYNEEIANKVNDWTKILAQKGNLGPIFEMVNHPSAIMKKVPQSPFYSEEADDRMSKIFTRLEEGRELPPHIIPEQNMKDGKFVFDPNLLPELDDLVYRFNPEELNINSPRKVELLADSSAAVTPAVEGESPEKENKSESKPQAVDGWVDGIKSYFDQSRLAWNYFKKNVEQRITQDPDKKKSIQQDIDSIVEEYISLPSLKGAANITSIGANIVGAALPIAVAGAVLAPEVALLAGGGLVVADMGKSIADSNLEMDSYEKKTGVEIPQSERTAYTVATVATDAIMNVMFNSNMFKGVTRNVISKVKNGLKGAIYENPVAQQEFNAMTQQVLKNERGQFAKLGAENLKESAVQGAMDGFSHEITKETYTHESPELENIVNSVVGGALSGAVIGTATNHLQPIYTHKDRMSRDQIYYSSNMKEASREQYPIQEVFPMNVIRDEKKPLKKPRLNVEHRVDREGGLYNSVVNSPNVVSGSYRKAHADGATAEGADAWNLPKEKLQDYGKKWKNALRISKKDKEESYAMQNEVIQSVAADMGVPVRVYASKEDVPDKYKGNKTIENSSAVTVDNDEIWFILDNCKKFGINEVVATIRHESVGHYGMPKTFDSNEEYKQALSKIGQQDEKAILEMDYKPADLRKDVEEYGSLMAEKREYNTPKEPGETNSLLYEVLRQSEERLRNTTTGEMRESINNIIRPYLDLGDNPMPSLLEIEQNKRYRRLDKMPYRVDK